jgi:hypothetical protein
VQAEAAESLPATQSVQTVAALASEYFGFAVGAERSSSQRVRAGAAVEAGGGARLRFPARVLAGRLAVAARRVHSGGGLVFAGDTVGADGRSAGSGRARAGFDEDGGTPSGERDALRER